MSFADPYLEKQRTNRPLITTPPSDSLNYIIVIPAYDEPGLLNLIRLIDSFPPGRHSSEIIAVLNWPVTANDSIKKEGKITAQKILSYKSENPGTGLRVHCIQLEDLPLSIAGVGFARKTGMDEAVRRFNKLNKSEGIIISLDADCTADPDLFTGLDLHYENNPTTPGCCHYFEHPLEGEEYSGEVYKAIAEYELYQRYYLHGLRFAGHPNSFYTVGSAFSVKAGEYCSQGGMNTRKAGEDFYFLQKFFDLGSFTECNHIRIIPSPRPSGRVPFGTGPSVIERVKSGKELKVFHPELFRIVGAFIKKIPTSRTHSDNLKLGNHPLMQEFLNINNIQSVVSEIRANSSGPQAYTKRFFRWFNMFRVLKFMNHGRKTFPDIPVSMAASELLGDMKIDSSGSTVELLIRLRNIDRNK